MGWSSSARANETLEALMDACYKQTKVSNQYSHKGVFYFFEPNNKDYVDGKIVGTIAKLNSNGMVIKETRFEIGADGKIKSGIGLKDLLSKKRPQAKETISIQKYRYVYAFDEFVYVDTKNKHPDPMKKMIWAYSKSGGVISDYAQYFEKVGKPIKIDLPNIKCATALKKKTVSANTIKAWVLKNG